MIEIFENLRTGGFGFRIEDDADQRVLQGGLRRYHNPGLFEEADCLPYAEVADALDYLTASDHQALMELILLSLLADAEAEAQAEVKAQAEAEAKLERGRIDAEDEAWLSCPPHGTRRTIKGRTLVSNYGRLSAPFFKKGGYREHLAPVSKEEARALIAGAMKVMYFKNSNRFTLKETS